jgi:hypothetical protein
MYENATGIGVNTTDATAEFHIVDAAKDDVALKVEGTQGELFSVVDNLDDLLHSVNDISGMPVFEVYADDRSVVHGTLEGTLKDAPATPAADKFRMYFFASGTTPNREVGVKIIMEDGNEYILCSVLV